MPRGEDGMPVLLVTFILALLGIVPITITIGPANDSLYRAIAASSVAYLLPTSLVPLFFLIILLVRSGKR